MRVRFGRFAVEDMVGVERNGYEDSLGGNFTTFIFVTSVDISKRDRPRDKCTAVSMAFTTKK